MATAKSNTKSSSGKHPKPAAKPVVARAVAAKPTPVKKTAAREDPVVEATPKAALAKSTRRSAAQAIAEISPEQRRNYIEVAAFYIAERRGFAPGNPLQDWAQAEAEIDRLLASGRLGG